MHEKLIIIEADNTAIVVNLNNDVKLSDIIVKHPSALGFYLSRPI